MSVARQITCHSSAEASALMNHATVALLCRVDVFGCVQQLQTVKVYLSTVIQTVDCLRLLLLCGKLVCVIFNFTSEFCDLCA